MARKNLMTDPVSLLARLLGTTPAARDYKLAENYALLRDAVFAAHPDSLGMVNESAGGVWGVVVECGYPERVASLVVMADGTVSLYFSNGGGIIGLGSHDGPQRASRTLLEFASRFLEYCDPASKFPLPRKENVRFYLFYQEMKLAAEAADADLSSDRHPLSPLFHVAHELISEIRKVDRNKGAA
jgi:hypothetical protein